MDPLTATQASDLADCFSQMAQVVSDYLDANPQLQRDQQKKLEDVNEQLLDIADKLFTTSATLVLDDASASLDTIRGITKEMNADFKHLKNVQKVMDVAGAILSLAASVVQKDPAAAKDNLKTLVAAWKE